jgi:hypothetical protein
MIGLASSPSATVTEKILTSLRKSYRDKKQLRECNKFWTLFIVLRGSTLRLRYESKRLVITIGL